MTDSPRRSMVFSRTSPFGEVLNPFYKDDAGLDLVVSERTLLAPLKRAPTDIPCGVRIALPDGVAALVVSRSSAVKRGIIVVPTLIDPGYRGEMFIFAYNMTDVPIDIQPGERIGQLVPFQAVPLTAVHFSVAGLDDLPPSDRGTRAFGSSGGNGG